MLNNDLFSFLQEGLAILMAHRNRELLTRGTRAYGLFIHEDKSILTFYVNECAFKNMQTELEENGEISLAIARPTDYRALQIKGKYLGHRNADVRDKMIIDRYMTLFVDEVVRAGAIREPFLRLPVFPAVAVEMKIEQVFNQTPGQGSGEEIK